MRLRHPRMLPRRHRIEAEKSADVQTSGFGFTSNIYYTFPKQVFQLKRGEQKPCTRGS